MKKEKYSLVQSSQNKSTYKKTISTIKSFNIEDIDSSLLSQQKIVNKSIVCYVDNLIKKTIFIIIVLSLMIIGGSIYFKNSYEKEVSEIDTIFQDLSTNLVEIEKKKQYVESKLKLTEYEAEKLHNDLQKLLGQLNQEYKASSKREGL